MVHLIDTELIAQLWSDETQALERCTIEIERSDLDEVRIGLVEDENTASHVYLARDRALRLGHALIEQALAEWKMP